MKKRKIRIKKIKSEDFVSLYRDLSYRLEDDEYVNVKNLDLEDVKQRVEQAQRILSEPMPNMIIAGEIQCIQAHLDKIKNDFMKQAFAKVMKEDKKK